MSGCCQVVANLFLTIFQTLESQPRLLFVPKAQLFSKFQLLVCAWNFRDDPSLTQVKPKIGNNEFFKSSKKSSRAKLRIAIFCQKLRLRLKSGFCWLCTTLLSMWKERKCWWIMSAKHGNSINVIETRSFQNANAESINFSKPLPDRYAPHRPHSLFSSIQEP